MAACRRGPPALLVSFLQPMLRQLCPLYPIACPVAACSRRMPPLALLKRLKALSFHSGNCKPSCLKLFSISKVVAIACLRRMPREAEVRVAFTRFRRTERNSEGQSVWIDLSAAPVLPHRRCFVRACFMGPSCRALHLSLSCPDVYSLCSQNIPIIYNARRRVA